MNERLTVLERKVDILEAMVSAIYKQGNAAFLVTERGGGLMSMNLDEN